MKRQLISQKSFAMREVCAENYRRQSAFISGRSFSRCSCIFGSPHPATIDAPACGIYTLSTDEIRLVAMPPI
jgi:hypothetical protein